MQRSEFNLVTYSNRVRTTARAVKFLQSVGVLNTHVNCSKCGKENSIVKRKANTAYFFFFCEDCKTMKSVRDQTILSNKHIGMRTLCILVYLFSKCQGLTLEQKLREVSWYIYLGGSFKCYTPYKLYHRVPWLSSCQNRLWSRPDTKLSYTFCVLRDAI